jgi:hypothetical protein
MAGKALGCAGVKCAGKVRVTPDQSPLTRPFLQLLMPRSQTDRN